MIKITQTTQAFLLAFFLTILNYWAFSNRFSDISPIPTVSKTEILIIEVIAVFLTSFFLFRLLSIFGQLFYKILSSLTILISAGASYYIAKFNTIIGYGIVASVFNTHDSEFFKEVIGFDFIIWIICGSVFPLILIWFTQISGTLNKQLFHFKGLLSASISLIIPFFVVYFLLNNLSETQKEIEKKSVDLPSYGGTVAHTYLPVNWLTALGLYTYSNINALQDYDDLPNPADQFNYQADSDLNDLYVVYIIGETTRGDHMGILGYPKDTTPLLSQEKNLAAFQGTACDTSTKLSLKCMFAKPGDALNDDARTLKGQNIFSTLMKLGFTSELFSMQGEVWFYSMLGVNNYEFREMITSEKKNVGHNIYDEILTEKVSESLNDYPKGKHLIILHTKGSHYLYTARYPRNFAKFKPECIPSDAPCTTEMIINSYDNTVLYTDYFIKSVLDQLRDKRAIVFYSSDHGESLEGQYFLHGTPLKIAPKEQLNIPIMVWMSDRLLEDPKFENRLNILQKKASKKEVLNHSEIFDSVLGCLGYESKDGINPNNNWCTK